MGMERSSGREVCPPRQPLPQELRLLQSVIARVVTVAEGRFAPGHLGELTQIVPFEMVDAVLAETGAVQARLRDLPSRVMVSAAGRCAI